MFASIVNTFVNCFKIPELKSRILFTLVVLAICRLTAYIHIPGLNGAALKAYFDQIHAACGGFAPGHVQSLHRRRAGELRRGRPGHHALHQRDDCDAIAHGRRAVA